MDRSNLAFTLMSLVVDLKLRKVYIYHPASALVSSWLHGGKDQTNLKSYLK